MFKPLVRVWRYESARPISDVIGGATGVVYLTSAEGEMTALTTQTGATLWRTEFGGVTTIPPVVDESRVYLATRRENKEDKRVGSANGLLRSLSAATGLTRWTADLRSELVSPIKIGEKHITSIDATGMILSVDKNSGATVWTRRLNSKATALAISGDEVFAITEDGRLTKLAQRSGITIWERLLPVAARRTLITVDAGRVYVGADDGVIQAVDRSDGKSLWRKDLRSRIRFLLAVDGGVAVPLLSNELQVLEGRGGGRLWKRQLTGRVGASPLVEGGALLVAPLSSGSCIVLDTRSGKLVNVVPVLTETAVSVRPVLAGRTLVLATDYELIGYEEGVAGAKAVVAAL